MWIATAKSERGLFSLLAHFLPHQRERANGDSSSRTPFRILDFIFSDVWRSSNTWANILNHCEEKIPSITPERYQCSFAKKNRDHSNTGFRICRISASLVTLFVKHSFALMAKQIFPQYFTKWRRNLYEWPIRGAIFTIYTTLRLNGKCERLTFRRNVDSSCMNYGMV